MCGRFNLFADGEQIALAFGLPETPQIVPRYNIAPSQPVAAVRLDAHGRRDLTYFYWGLIPGWAKDDSMASRLINARSETAHEKPSFRNAFKRRRCIVPANGFYEWQKLANGRKQPLHIHFAGHRLFGIAGLWEEWQEIVTCTLLTTDANADVAPAHDRMPVILHPDDYDAWLDVEAPLPAAQALLRPLRGDKLRLTPISAYVNAPANEGCTNKLSVSLRKGHHRVFCR